MDANYNIIISVVLVHGEWGQWSTYAPCDATCGTGSQIRTRSCRNVAHDGNLCLKLDGVNLADFEMGSRSCSTGVACTGI